jgi:hypothetical protein
LVIASPFILLKINDFLIFSMVENTMALVNSFLTHLLLNLQKICYTIYFALAAIFEIN